MRAVLIILLVIAAIVIGGVLSSNYLFASSDSINQEINILQKEVKKNNWIKAQEQVVIIKEKWDDIKNNWAMLIDHNEIDNIDLNLKRMEEYVEALQSADSLAEISSLKLLFEHIPEKETLSIKNIL